MNEWKSYSIIIEIDIPGISYWMIIEIWSVNSVIN